MSYDGGKEPVSFLPQYFAHNGSQPFLEVFVGREFFTGAHQVNTSLFLLQDEIISFRRLNVEMDEICGDTEIPIYGLGFRHGEG